MKHLETNIGPSRPHWGEKEQTVSALVPLMTGTALSHNSRIPAFVNNPSSCAQSDGNDSMSSAPYG